LEVDSVVVDSFEIQHPAVLEKGGNVSGKSRKSIYLNFTAMI